MLCLPIPRFDRRMFHIYSARSPMPTDLHFPFTRCTLHMLSLSHCFVHAFNRIHLSNFHQLDLIVNACVIVGSFKYALLLYTFSFLILLQKLTCFSCYSIFLTTYIFILWSKFICYSTIIITWAFYYFVSK